MKMGKVSIVIIAAVLGTLVLLFLAPELVERVTSAAGAPFDHRINSPLGFFGSGNNFTEVLVANPGDDPLNVQAFFVNGAVFDGQIMELPPNGAGIIRFDDPGADLTTGQIDIPVNHPPGAGLPHPAATFRYNIDNALPIGTGPADPSEVHLLVGQESDGRRTALAVANQTGETLSCTGTARLANGDMFGGGASFGLGPFAQFQDFMEGIVDLDPAGVDPYSLMFGCVDESDTPVPTRAVSLVQDGDSNIVVNEVSCLNATGVLPTAMVDCDSTKDIYRNRTTSSKDVTIQVTNCPGASSSSLQIINSNDNTLMEEFFDDTASFTFTVPAGGKIKLNCSDGDEGGSCEYTLSI